MCFPCINQRLRFGALSILAGGPLLPQLSSFGHWFFRLEYLRRIPIIAPLRLCLALPLLLWRKHALLSLHQKLEPTHVPTLYILRVLQHNHIAALELLITDQIPPFLRLDVQPLNRLVREGIASVP